MKKLTWLTGSLLLIFLILIAWLCFFQFPSQDDYAGSYLEKKYGLAGAIQWYLREKNGRFTSIPVFLTISSSKSLLSQYGLLLLGFLITTFCCIFFFVRICSRHLFEPVLNGLQIAGFSAMMLLVFLDTVPEVSSFIYWVATSVTYLVPFAFFLLLIGAYFSLFKAQPKHQWLQMILIGVATCLLGGCNEVMLFYVCALPFLIGLTILGSGKPVPVQITVIAILAILLLIAAVLMPGNDARAGHFVQNQSWATSVAGATFRTWQTLQCIFSSSLFYLSCLGILIASGYLKPPVVAWFASKKSNWLVETGCVVGMIFCFNLVIRQIGGEIVPPRATNIIVCISLLGFWWIMLMNAARIHQLLRVIHDNRQLILPVFSLAYCLALIGSEFSSQLMKNLVEAPLHAAILKQREAVILREKASGRNLATVKPYQEEVALLIKEKYKDKGNFVMDEFTMPPSFSYFQDEPNKKEYAYFYAEYYGIDTIVSTNGKFVRWGLLRNSRK